MGEASGGGEVPDGRKGGGGSGVWDCVRSAPSLDWYSPPALKKQKGSREKHWVLDRYYLDNIIIKKSRISYIHNYPLKFIISFLYF